MTRPPLVVSRRPVDLSVVTVSIDVELDVDVAEPLANVGVHSEDSSDVDVGADG